MPTSATGERPRTNGCGCCRRYAVNGFGCRRRYAVNGFTLIELMVVLVIIGLASAAVVLAIPDPGGRVHDEAERLAARALAVRDDAIVQGRSTRLVIGPTSYAAERRTMGRWQPYPSKVFSAVNLPAGIVATTGETGRVVASFDATGAAEPVVVALGKGTVVARVDIPANGAIRVAP